MISLYILQYNFLMFPYSLPVIPFPDPLVRRPPLKERADRWGRPLHPPHARFVPNPPPPSPRRHLSRAATLAPDRIGKCTDFAGCGGAARWSRTRASCPPLSSPPHCPRADPSLELITLALHDLAPLLSFPVPQFLLVPDSAAVNPSSASRSSRLPPHPGCRLPAPRPPLAPVTLLGPIPNRYGRQGAPRRRPGGALFHLPPHGPPLLPELPRRAHHPARDPHGYRRAGLCSLSY
jgi:hypothetical protein